MNLSNIRDLVSLFNNGPVTPGVFASAYTGAELKLFAIRYSEGNMESLGKFRVTKGNDTPPLYVSEGMATLPTDYFAFESAYHFVDNEPVLVNFVNDKMFDVLQAHAIEYPTMDYPIGNIQGDYVRVRPKALKFIVFTYLTKPVPCVYATTDTEGYQQFDEANSTTVKWYENDVPHLVQFILQSLGVQTSINDITQKLKQ